MTIKSRGLARSRGKLKPVYIHYHNVCSYQTWQCEDTHWGVSLHKIMQPLDQVILQGHVKYYYISVLLQCLWPPNLSGLLHSMRSFPPLICNIMSYLPYHNGYRYKTWQSGSIQWKAFSNKALWSCGLAISRDKLNMFYLYYHKTSSH